MMKLLLFSIILFLANGLWAQVHQDAFARLPDIGAKSPSLFVQGHYANKSNEVFPPNYFINTLRVNSTHLNDDYQKDLYFCDHNTHNQLKGLILTKTPTASPNRQGTTPSIPLQLFPNPSYGQLIIEGILPKKASFTLLSPFQQEVTRLFPKSLTPSQYRLFAERTELAYLSPGLYYVCVEGDGVQCIPWLKE